MELFLWPPNWGANVVERMEWLTDVQQSSNGTEVRRSLRVAPRSSLTFELLAQGADAIRLRNFIQTNQGQKVLVPWWVSGIEWVGTSFEMLDIPARLGISSTYAMGYGPAGSQVLITKNGQPWVRPLSTSSGSSLAVASAQWPVPGPERPGAILYPMVECYLNASASLTAPTGGVLHGSITFEAAQVVPHEPTTLPTQHNNLPVLVEQPNRIQDHTVEYNRLVSELDFMTGKRSSSDRSGQSFRAVSHEYGFHKYAEIIPFKSFLSSLQGRKGSLYLPSFSCDFYDLHVLTWSNQGQAQLLYADAGYRLLPVRPEAIQIQSSAGTLYRNVNQLTPYGWEERLYTDSLPGPSTTVQSAMILHRSRLATDSIEITWHSSEVATVTLPFRTIRRA